MTTLDLRRTSDAHCFGCGRVVDGTALEVWAATGGPVLAVLCQDCRADATVREALAGHLITQDLPARARICWVTDDPAIPLPCAPTTKAAILERLIAGDSFSFGT